jgi:glycosyltransferase involved in cell wall biosynthesis
VQVSIVKPIEPKLLLSITIPTWNRGTLVVKQLQALVEGLALHADKVEIVVCDNCSTDNTAELVQQFIQQHPSFLIRLVQNKQNVGIVGNCKVCIEEANGKYTWLLGDDDLVSNSLLKEIVETLNAKQYLGMLKMNFKHVYEMSLDSPTQSQPFYNIEEASFEADGKAFCERLIANKNSWGFIWISAYIIKSANLKKLVQEDWLNNMATPLYLSLATAKNEPCMFINKPNDIMCYAAENSWGSKYKMVDWIDLPITFGRLVKLGYSKTLFFKQLLKCYNPKKFISIASIKFAFGNGYKMVSAILFFNKSLFSSAAK